MKILIVDDDFAALTLLRRMLEREHTVRVVSDEKDALDAARTMKPDLFLVDILLSIGNGLDVIAHARPVLPSTHIVAMTNLPGDDIIDDSFAAGANFFVSKDELVPALLVILELLGAALRQNCG